jgi:DNA-binding NarL/FixJ family response regulator
VLTENPPPSPEERVTVRLTPRELTVLTLIAEGLTAAAAARRLGVSPRTVAKHQQNLYRKLGTSDRLVTVLRGQALGLLASPAPGTDG